MTTLVIVGASLAGLSAAIAARSAGYDGSIVLIDAEDALPADRPPLSKQVLTGEWDVGRATQPGAARLAELDVDLRLGIRVEQLDAATRTLRLSDGTQIVADGIVLAPGGSPRRLPVEWATAPDVHVLRTAADAVGLAATLDALAPPGGGDCATVPGADDPRVMVVGAGFIGSEVASSCRSRGIAVTLIDGESSLLSRVLHAPIGAALERLHRSSGVDVRLGTVVESVSGPPGDRDVTLTDGSTIKAAAIVLGVGMVPNTDWLAGSGLEIDNGIVCDERSFAAPGIVAAGDAARWYHGRYGQLLRVEQWDHAIEHGTHAGQAIAQWLADPDSSIEPFTPVPMFWSDQYGSKFQSAGRLSPNGEFRLIDGSLDSDKFVGLIRDGDEVGGVVALNRPAAVIRWRVRLLAPGGVAWADAPPAVDEMGG